MKGKIQRLMVEDDVARMHEAVSESVYVVGAKAAERAVGEIAVGEQPSGTLTDMVNNITKARVVKFLHVSDNHSAMNGINKVEEILSESANGVLCVHTGDLPEAHWSLSQGKVVYRNYQRSIDAMSNWNAEHTNKPFLFVKGNHDAIIQPPTDATGGDVVNEALQKARTALFLKPINGNVVTWGESVDGLWNDNIISGYWYKDVAQNGVKVRFIGLDEYEHRVGDPTRGGLYYWTKVYSQAQVDWLVNLLRSTPSDAYIVMCHHQPLYTMHPDGVMNDFVHHGISGSTIDSSHTYTNTMFTYKPENVDMPAQIVNAYLHKKHLQLPAYPSGVDGVTLNINADFRGITPAKFACHLSGHVHGDFCEYHPDYPEQLCLTICTDSPSASSWYDDIVRSTTAGDVASYAINRVTIDADRDVVRIDRLGAHELNTSLNWITQDGSSRDWIEFAIPNINEEPVASSGRQVARPTITADWSYEDYGNPASRSALEGRLDNYYPEWRSESAMVALVDAYVAGNDVSGLTLTLAGFNAINTVFIDMDAEGNDMMTFANAVTEDPALSADNYVEFGQTDAVAPVLPDSFTAADEFLFTFICASDNCTLTLPSGVEYGNGLDFDSDKKAGRKFQVSICDGITLYAYVDLNS